MSDKRDFSLQDFTRYMSLLLKLIPISLFKGSQKAQRETEFSYKNCCNDETGTYICLIGKGLIKKNTSKVYTD